MHQANVFAVLRCHYLARSIVYIGFSCSEYHFERKKGLGFEIIKGKQFFLLEFFSTLKLILNATYSMHPISV